MQTAEVDLWLTFFPGPAFHVDCSQRRVNTVEYAEDYTHRCIPSCIVAFSRSVFPLSSSFVFSSLKVGLEGYCSTLYINANFLSWGNSVLRKCERPYCSHQRAPFREPIAPGRFFHTLLRLTHA